MKIGIFTDSHYSSRKPITIGRDRSRSLQKIKETYEVFEKEKCDLAICLGDLTDEDDTYEKEVENLRKISEVMKNSSVPTMCVMGNHDAFVFTVDDFYKLLGEEFRPENKTFDDVNLVFVDACYFKSGEHYMPGDSDWRDTFYPHTKELKEHLSTLEGKTYVFMHQNIDPGCDVSHRLANDEEIRGILENSGSVKTVYQGHYHCGNRNEVNGIRYVTHIAMCSNEDAYIIDEI